MYRLQAEAALVDKASQRLDQARSECKQAQAQQKVVASQIENAEARKRNSQNTPDEKIAEQLITNLQATVVMWAAQAQECQPEEVDAETQFRAEQAKMNELQGQLDQLDQILASHGRK